MDDDFHVLISRSKILDAFIIEDESPSIIFAFLEQHDDIFTTLINGSLYWTRLFQLDFFLKCTNEQRLYLLNKINNKSIPIEISAYLIWQILISTSLKANAIKYECRKLISKINNISTPAHPYRFFTGDNSVVVKAIDNYCIALSNHDNISAIPNLISKQNFNVYFSNIRHSLFSSRLLQYDIFANTDYGNKYVMLNNAIHANITQNDLRFILQIFDSNEPIPVKQCCYSKIRELEKNGNSNNIEMLLTAAIGKDIYCLINDVSSIEEFILKSTIYNYELTPYIILYLLYTKPKWIKNWMQIDVENLNCILNISDFVSTI